MQFVVTIATTTKANKIITSLNLQFSQVEKRVVCKVLMANQEKIQVISSKL